MSWKKDGTNQVGRAEISFGRKERRVFESSRRVEVVML